MNARDGRSTALQRDAAPVKVVAHLAMGLGGPSISKWCEATTKKGQVSHQ